jgi:HD superfamily phosphohydrolase
MPAELNSAPLTIPDPIYGPVMISEPVLVALLKTTAVQRLGGVLQHGITGLIGVSGTTTRLAHSVGVMALVRRLGGSLAEQVAALLHDVSHTAMSHVIDYVYQQPDEQSYHEEMKGWYLEQSDIPPVLARHGWAWQDFLPDEPYPLLEQPAPALCADRVDYFLRDGVEMGLLTPAQVGLILDHLLVVQNRIVVDQLEVARLMAYTYIAADEASWASFREVALYELTARAIQTGLELGVITEADFWGVDQALWDKLNAAPDAALQKWLPWISVNSQFEWDEARPTFWVSSKIRTIDPDILIGRTLRPLSELDPAFAQVRQNYLATKQGRWPVRVVGFPAA